MKQDDDSTIKTVMFLILGAITIALGVWIYIKMRNVKKVLLEEQETRRVKKAESVEMTPSVKTAFERRYDNEPYEAQSLQPQPYRTYEPQVFEHTMVPTQPARML